MNERSISHRLFLHIIILFITSIASSSWNDEVVEIIGKARPGVVRIEAKAPISERLGALGKMIASHTDGTSTRKWFTTVASGVWWNPDGYVVTIASAVKDAEKCYVKTYSGRTLNARIVGMDSDNNIAVLKCRITANMSIHVIPHRTGSMPEGSWIALLGYGYGGVPTISTGISGVPPESPLSTHDWFQFTAPVRPGNSGSAVIDADGNLAGLVLGREEDIGAKAVLNILTKGSATKATQAAIPHYSPFGIGIPITKLASVVENITKERLSPTGWIGVAVKESRCKLEGKDVRALEIIRIIDGSPALSAGLKVGDCLLQVGEKKLEKAVDLGAIIAGKSPGEVVEIRFSRKGALHSLQLTIEERPSHDLTRGHGADRYPSQAGVSVQELSPALRRHFHVNESSGVLVSNVDDRSPLAAILHVGDIVTRINRHPIYTPADFQRRIGDPDIDVLAFEIYRNGSRLSPTLTLKSD